MPQTVKPSSMSVHNPFQRRKVDSKEAVRRGNPKEHVYGNKVRCITESRGYPTPKNRSPSRYATTTSW